MTWLTLRQFRLQAGAAVAAVALAAVVFAATAPDLLPDVSVYEQLSRTQQNLFISGVLLLALAPALVGAFWGAPLITRELETGTHRLVWNQGVTRTRWLAVKLGLTGLAAAASVGLLSLVVTWWSGPMDGALSDTSGSLPARMTPVTFAMRGIVPAAYALFAVVLGVAVGLLLRRTVAAMAVTLVVYTLVQVAVPLWVRAHLAAPVHRTVAITEQTLDGIGIRDDDPASTRLTVQTGAPGAWTLHNRTVDAAGRPVTVLPASFAECLPPPPSRSDAGTVPTRPDLTACFAALRDLGYRQELVYQPADRFWRLQWTETGVFVALSGLLAAFCFRRIRRI